MKSRFLFLLSAAVVLLSGCVAEVLQVEGGSIRATMEGEQTRTSVTDEGTFTWSEGDQVWLHTTGGSVAGTLTSGAGTSSANFSYGSYFGEMTGKAVNPYNSGHSISGDVLSVVMPASYDLGSELSSTNAAMYGVNVNGNIRFNHLAGVMRFKFRNVPAGVNKFVVTLDKKINGTFTADLTEDYPIIEATEAASDEEKTITLNFDALAEASEVNLYIPLPIGTYNSLDLALMSDEEVVWEKTGNATNTVNRKSLLLMPTVNLSGSIGGDIEGGDTPSVPDEGDTEYNQYIVYNGMGNNNNVIVSGDDYWLLNPFFYSRVSDIDEIELKFQMGPGSTSAWLFSSQRPYINNGARLTSDGLVLRYDNYGEDVITNEEIITWNDMDVSITDKIVLNISVSQKKITVNGKEISVPELETFTDIDYLFSNYYYIDPVDGYAKQYYTVPVESKLYYAKIWNTSGSILYHGYASEGEKSAGNTQPVWKSEYNGSTYLEFPNTNFQLLWVGTFTTNWLPFGGGIDADDTPTVSEAVDLSAAGTANSYIVSEAGSYMFTPTKGNSSESVGTISSVEVLWETFGTNETPSVGSLISNARYEGNTIFFDTPSTFREGNAVLAAKDASGNILWSWHIWLTDEPESQVYYNNAGTVMDRNLGATSATPGNVGALGLLYQWGRKDPFLGSSSISSATVAKSTLTWPSSELSTSSVGTIEYAVAHPTTFITSSNTRSDWMYSQDITRWQSEKTIYDPCPAGWRVPEGGNNGIWATALGSSTATYDSTNEGINFSGKFGDATTIWYPAAGYIEPSGAVLNLVGSYGDYWSVTPTSSEAHRLDINSTGAYPKSYNMRSCAFSVRCVQDGSSSDVPEEPSAPETQQGSYSVQLKPSTYGWKLSTSVSNPDASLYDGVYESTNQGLNDTKSIMYIDIDGYDEFTIYIRSYAESTYDYVQVSNLDTDISSVKMHTSGNQNSDTSLSSYTEVTFTNIGGGQHRIMVVYKKDYSQHSNDDKGYVLIPKNQRSSTPEVPSEPQKVDYVDEYGINHGQGVEIDGVIWAPVNCGYHADDYKYGKLYQWGRKYGQGYNSSDASVPSIISGPVSLATGQSESNSNKFYYNSSSPYDWAISQDGTLWNSGTQDNPVKTDYDPCPEGWRVPTYAELSALKANKSSWTTNDSQKGYWFSGSTTYSTSVSRVFFPAAGDRNDDGDAYDRDGFGYYWSSRPYSSSAYYFCFYSGGVGMSYNSRASGYSVRCVQVTD